MTVLGHSSKQVQWASLIHKNVTNEAILLSQTFLSYFGKTFGSNVPLNYDVGYNIKSDYLIIKLFLIDYSNGYELVFFLIWSKILCYPL